MISIFFLPHNNNLQINILMKIFIVLSLFVLLAHSEATDLLDLEVDDSTNGT